MRVRERVKKRRIGIQNRIEERRPVRKNKNERKKEGINYVYYRIEVMLRFTIYNMVNNISVPYYFEPPYLRKTLLFHEIISHIDLS